MTVRLPAVRPIAAAAACLIAAGCGSGLTDPVPARVAEAPALVTHGSLDRDAHPAVVLILMEEGGRPKYTCSGTLIAPTVVLTAGHCVGEPGEFSGMRIYTESDVEHGDNSFPYAGKNSVEARAWHAHPQYTNAAFVLHDVGVIQLRKAVTLPAAAYGRLPQTANELDALKPQRTTTFTAVGYGTQRINPAQDEHELVRMRAEPHLLQINTAVTGGYSLMLSNNASTGGTCFGDSGGPNYLGTSNVVAGVTSFGLNGTCGGTGGVFRLDRQDVLDFVRQFLR